MFAEFKKKNSISPKLANWLFYVFFIFAAGVHSAYGANITIDDATVTETSGGTFIYFNVNIDAADASNNVTVNYTVNDGTATNSGGDFDNGGGSGSVTLAKFQTTVQIGINTQDDSVFEGTETFSITLNSVSHGHVITDSSATGTILDDEIAPTVNLTNAALAAEGNSGNVVDITLSHAAKVDIDVDYAFSDGTAVNGVDYTGVDGTATISAGSTFVGVAAATITDGIDEAAYETFTVTISNPTASWATLGSTDTETITVIDVDGGLSIDDVTVSEAAGNASVTVTLQGPTAAPLTVDYATADNTAVAGSDYTGASSTTLSFSAVGNTLTPVTQTITVPINDDATFEGSETFSIGLSNVSGAAVLTDANAVITITDNDSTPTVDFNATSSSGAESSSSTALQVDLSNASASNVTVNYAVTGTATGGGTDYTLANGTLTITAGNTTGTITIASIIDDAFNEGNETVIVTLSSPSGATLGSDTVHTYTITDTDGTPTIDINATSSGGVEATSSAALQVDLSSASASNVTVNFVVTGTATGGGTDYTLADGALTINAGNTTGTITIASIVDDAITEGDETVIVTLSAPSGATLGSDRVHTYTIADNDAVTGNVSDAQLSSAIQAASDVFQIDDRRYNIRMADQSRKIIQISMNTNLSGGCGSLSSHSLCGVSNLVNKAITNRDNSNSTNTQVGIPDVDISGGDDGTNGKISFVDVDALLDDGAKRIVSVTADFSENKNGSDTNSIMVSYARETFDPIRSSAIGIFTHLHRAKTDVNGVYSGNAKVQGFNVGLYVNNFGNENYVTSGYASVGYSHSAYKLSSAGTFINNRFDTYNTQAGVSLMGKQELGDILFMPKFTLDAFVTMQEKSAPKVVVGSAERVGFLTQRVLTEVQVGFRPHVTLDLSEGEFDSALDVNPQIFCGYAANLSDCGWGLEISSATKPDGENTEYRIDLGYESYRGDTTARIKMQMESNPLGTTDVYSTTTLTNDFTDISIDGVRQNPGIEWEFGVRY